MANLKQDHLESDDEFEGQHLLPKPAKSSYGGAPGASSETEDDKGFLEGLQDDYGSQLLWLLFVVQHLLKGFSYTLTATVLPFVWLEYHLPAPQSQIYTSLMSLPWAAKPMLGLLSDLVPINGYRKGPYMLLLTVMGFAAIVYAGAPALGFSASTTVVPVVVCGVLFNMQCSGCDLLTEAVYVAKIAPNPKRGPALVSFVWFGMTLAGLVGVFMSGYMIHWAGYRFCFLVAAVPAAAVLIPLALGHLQERQETAETIAEIRNRYADQIETCFLGMLMFCGTLLIMVVGFTSQNVWLNFAVAASVGVVMLIAFSVLLSPLLAKYNAFCLLQVAMASSYSSASFYFFTDSPEMFPSGPHFSKYFFTTVMSTVAGVCSLIGIFTYQRYLSKWGYRSIMLLANVLVSVLALCDMLIFSRMNTQLGIPDQFFVLSMTVAETITQQWAYMPIVVMMASLCPKGMEATMYALLAGCQNLGYIIASSAGALLLEIFEVRPSGSIDETAQFENLWRVSGVAAVLPLITVLALYRLLPNAAPGAEVGSSDSLVTPESATEGSLWKQWKASRQSL